MQPIFNATGRRTRADAAGASSTQRAHHRKPHHAIKYERRHRTCHREQSVGCLLQASLQARTLEVAKHKKSPHSMQKLCKAAARPAPEPPRLRLRRRQAGPRPLDSNGTTAAELLEAYHLELRLLGARRPEPCSRSRTPSDADDADDGAEDVLEELHEALREVDVKVEASKTTARRRRRPTALTRRRGRRRGSAERLVSTSTSSLTKRMLWTAPAPRSRASCGW